MSIGLKPYDAGGGAVQIGGTDAIEIDSGLNVTIPQALSVTGAITATGGIAGDFKMNSGYGSIATAYGCRAWVNFDGTSNTANLSGTYSQSGTTVTVTATAHGLIAGNVVYSDITTGAAVDGTYTVATVTDANTFTYTAGTSLTTSGNVTLRRNTIRASGNVSSITDNGTGDYTVNFTTAMPDANYAISVSGGSSSTIAAGNGWTAVYSGVEATTSCRVLSGTWSTSRIQQDAPTMCVAIFR